MIIEIFILFTVLAFLLSVVGYYINNELLIIFGFLTFGLMSIPLIAQSLEFKTGDNTTIEYNYTNTSLLDIETQEKVYTYSNYSDTIWFGIFFIFISLSGLFYIYDGYAKEKGDGE